MPDSGRQTQAFERALKYLSINLKDNQNNVKTHKFFKIAGVFMKYINIWRPGQAALTFDLNPKSARLQTFILKHKFEKHAS